MESLDAVCELLIHRKREDLAQLLSQATIDYELNDIGSAGEFDITALVNAVIFAPIPVYEELLVLNSEASQLIHDAVSEVCYATHGRSQYIQDIDYRLVAKSLTLDDELKVPTDPIECVLQLKSIMIDRVTYHQGGAESNSLYVGIRQVLMKNEDVRERLPHPVRVCRLLDDLWVSRAAQKHASGAEQKCTTLGNCSAKMSVSIVQGLCPLQRGQAWGLGSTLG